MFWPMRLLIDVCRPLIECLCHQLEIWRCKEVWLLLWLDINLLSVVNKFIIWGSFCVCAELGRGNDLVYCVDWLWRGGGVIGDGYYLTPLPPLSKLSPWNYKVNKVLSSRSTKDCFTDCNNRREWKMMQQLSLIVFWLLTSISCNYCGWEARTVRSPS